MTLFYISNTSATGWMIRGSSTGRGWGLPSLLSNGYQGLFPWG